MSILSFTTTSEKESPRVFESFKFRKLGNQIDEVCERQGLLKRDIADKMGCSASYLSQIIIRGGTADQIEQIAKAVNVEPYYFDRYHILTLLERIETHDEFALQIAALLIEGYKMSSRKRKEIMARLAA